MRGVVWLRTDLRLNDNTALFNASRECKDGLIVLHCIPTDLNNQAHFNPRQYALAQKQLAFLHGALNQLNIPLLVKVVDNMDAVPALILSLMREHQIDTLYYNARYDLAQRTQDRHIHQALIQAQLQANAYTDHLIAPPGELLTPKEKPFTSLTAFKKAWQGFLRHAHIHPLGAIEKQTLLIAPASTLPALPWTLDINSPWDFTEQHAQAILQRESQDTCDIHHMNPLHALFTYLNTGLLSPRQFVHMLLQGEHFQNKQEVDQWLNLLIAREFNQHIMYHFPHICSGHDFTPHMHTLPWKKDATLLAAWQQGQTGYPLIDASMRCLNQTGFLVEDLLQVTTLFFTKILFLDYRLGEQYFAAKRIDYDFANNNALWQWSASTGAESVLYARIPQPARQSEVFDSNGDFIRKYCPELAKMNAVNIHDPYNQAGAMAATVNIPSRLWIIIKCAKRRFIILRL